VRTAATDADGHRARSGAVVGAQAPDDDPADAATRAQPRGEESAPPADDGVERPGVTEGAIANGAPLEYVVRAARRRGRAPGHEDLAAAAAGAHVERRRDGQCRPRQEPHEPRCRDDLAATARGGPRLDPHAVDAVAADLLAGHEPDA